MPILAIVAFCLALVFFLLAIIFMLPLAAGAEPWRGLLVPLGLFCLTLGEFVARGGMGG